MHAVKIHIDNGRCQGHGRCYAVAPQLFEPDALGNGRVVGDGAVAPELAGGARRAVANCPEQAITLSEENPDG